MPNCTDAANESPVPTVRSLPPSPVDSTTQPPLHATAPADHISSPIISASEEDDLARALRLSQLSADDFDEQVQVDRPRRVESASTREQAHPSPPPNESDEDELELELALNMSQLPADVFDEQAIELNRQNGSNTADEEDLLAFMVAEISLLENMQRALGLVPPVSGSDVFASGLDDYSEALMLVQRGTSLLQRYLNSGVLPELQEGIDALRIANQFIPDSHPMRAEYLNNLGVSLRTRFERLGDIGDLEEAIIAQQQAVRITPDGHPDKPRPLNNLGSSLRTRFERLGDTGDLDEAITAQRQAVRITPDGHPDKPGRHTNLGSSLLTRFEHLGDIGDLEEAITAQQQAVRITPDGHPGKPVCLNNLGNSLQTRFQRLGDIGDLDEAITAQQQAVRIMPDSHPDKPVCLSSLGISLRTRFERLGDIDNLEEAITAQQQAVCITPDGHPDKPGCLNNLGNSLLARFERLGDIGNLEEAITAQRQAVRITPDNHPDKPGPLNNLGLSLRTRFERLGDIGDLDEAINAQQQAVRITPDGHPDKPGRLSNLGGSLLARFERLGDIGDLNEAITAQQQDVHITPDGHPEKPAGLNNLASSLITRFEHLGDIGDLEEATTAQQQAVCITPDGHPDKPGRLSNLGTLLETRFESLGDIGDLEEAITAQQQAIRITPDGHPDKPRPLNALGRSLRTRFERLGDIGDLDEAITAQQQAVHITPDGHPDKPGYLTNLGKSLLTRFQRQPDATTLAHAISACSQSAKSSSGRPYLRFVASRSWAALCFSAHPREALDAYSNLIELLPRVVWLGRTVEQRYKDISAVGDAVTEAVATAIHFGEFNLALEWLEQGRSIVWGQMLQLRSPLDELRRHHPNEAVELEKISHALDSAGTISPGASSDNSSQSLEAAAQAHRRLAKEYDCVLTHIRDLPGFEEFLQPKKTASFCHAVTSGPVVVVNVHSMRCDALVLLPHSFQVSHVPLSTLQVSAVKKMQIQLAELTRGADVLPRHFAHQIEVGASLPDILGQLWSCLVEPILGHLSLLQKPVSKFPHVTWCLTGPLTFLPIHAAGLYDGDNQPKIFEYVVSSYTPTLSALLTAQRQPLKSNPTSKLLIITQPATPGQNLLPGTIEEANAIQTLQAQAGQLDITRLNDREATVTAVLQHMKGSNWIHLACHGTQDVASPTESAFLLIDNQLTLKEIMKQSFTHTELAFLSACQTAKGDSKLPEEAIHLAAGMLMAGYGNIVATMWSIQDDAAPTVAERFYRYLIEEADGDSTKAAYALHNAIAYLRDKRGEKDFASWVPFIHLGVCSPLPE